MSYNTELVLVRQILHSIDKQALAFYIFMMEQNPNLKSQQIFERRSASNYNEVIKKYCSFFAKANVMINLHGWPIHNKIFWFDFFTSVK